jgi:hypothetical protein
MAVTSNHGATLAEHRNDNLLQSGLIVHGQGVQEPEYLPQTLFK